jgi:hypothetical protein
MSKTAFIAKIPKVVRLGLDPATGPDPSGSGSAPLA